MEEDNKLYFDENTDISDTFQRFIVSYMKRYKYEMGFMHDFVDLNKEHLDPEKVYAMKVNFIMMKSLFTEMLEELFDAELVEDVEMFGTPEQKG
jgi:hypothetical protein